MRGSSFFPDFEDSAESGIEWSKVYTESNLLQRSLGENSHSQDPHISGAGRPMCELFGFVLLVAGIAALAVESDSAVLSSWPQKRLLGRWIRSLSKSPQYLVVTGPKP